jgi:hypothetical protein
MSWEMRFSFSSSFTLVSQSLLVAAFAAGCCASEPPAAFPSTSTQSYSSSSGSVSGQSEPRVPAREAVSAGLVVRPDQLCLPFALRSTDADATRAVRAIEAVTAELQAKLRAVDPKFTLRMRGVVASPLGTKKEGDASVHPMGVVADGVFEVPLDPGADYWARSRLVAWLSAFTAAECDARAATPVHASFEAPRMQVASPDAFRAKLTEAWVRQAREFASAAHAGDVALVLDDCAPPGEITERAISNEEVGLSLTVTCKLVARK